MLNFVTYLLIYLFTYPSTYLLQVDRYLIYLLTYLLIYLSTYLYLLITYLRI